METVTKSYNTWHQFVTDSDQTNRLNPHRYSSRNYRYGWYGTDTWEEAMYLAKSGWPEGLRRIRQQVKIIERFISPRTPRLELSPSVMGPGMLDFERYTQGRPDQLLTWSEREDTHGYSTRTVPIVFNCAASCGVSTETLFHRGAAVCALIDILEHSRIRVDLTLADKFRDRNVGIFTVRVKKAEEVLDMDRIAFALCNAATPRRLMFSIAEQNLPDLSQTYGRPDTYTEDGAINLHSASLYIRKEQDMVPWLIEQLKEFGIEVDD